MQKKVISGILICILLFPLYVVITSVEETTGQENIKQAEDFFNQQREENKPCTKANGEKFTIGYIDIDPYLPIGEMVYDFVLELEKEGWIELREELPFSSDKTDAKQLINYLAQQDLGPYIQFSKDVNYYISEKYDGIEYTKRDLEKHIKNKEVDLMFCMGTEPALLLKNEMNITEIPIMVSGTVDPVGAKISESEEYSGQSNFWCHTNTGLYKNQLNFYYNSYPFQNLGMVYYSETLAAINQYTEAAESLGINIIDRKVNLENSENYYEELNEEYKDLVAEGIDAFLLNTDIIREEKEISSLLEVFYEKKIPVFVQSSEYYVEDGATMIISASDAEIQSPFLVDAFSEILHGKEPGTIYQKFVTPPYLSVNLKVADRIGFDVNEKMLLSAEKIYTYVKKVE